MTLCTVLSSVSGGQGLCTKPHFRSRVVGGLFTGCEGSGLLVYAWLYKDECAQHFKGNRELVLGGSQKIKIFYSASTNIDFFVSTCYQGEFL